MATLEQVEKLREKANVTYDEAKAALAACNDDLLDAMIYLEKQGKTREPSGGGYYTSEKAGTGSQGNPNAQYGQNQAASGGQTFGDLLKRFGRFCVRVIKMGNVNTFEVSQRGEVKAVFPVTVLVLLLVFMFWISIPLLIIGLFFGFTYRFRGPHLENNTVNGAMDSAANVAEDIKKSIKTQSI